MLDLLIHGLSEVIVPFVITDSWRGRVGIDSISKEDLDDSLLEDDTGSMSCSNSQVAGSRLGTTADNWGFLKKCQLLKSVYFL